MTYVCVVFGQGFLFNLSSVQMFWGAVDDGAHNINGSQWQCNVAMVRR